MTIPSTDSFDYLSVRPIASPIVPMKQAARRHYGSHPYFTYLNRWIQPDTIVPQPGNPQDLNRYSYARNNPLKYVDPTGHWPDWVDRISGGVTQYMNDMTFGTVGELYRMTTGLSMDMSPNADFQAGRDIGRAVSTAQAIGETGHGLAMVATGAAAGPPTVALAAGAAAPSGGLSVIPGAIALTAEGVMVLGGALEAGLGTLQMTYIKNSPINQPTGSGSGVRFADTKELAKRLGVRENEVHKIKEAILKDKDITPLLKELGAKNPDIGWDNAGNIVLKNRNTGATVNTGIPLGDFTGGN